MTNETTSSPVELRLRDVLARAVDLYGQTPAVVCDEISHTWAELQDRVFRLANAMAERGIGRGDRVAISQQNGPEIPEVAFATALLGAALVPISPRLAPAEMHFIASDAGARLLFADESIDCELLPDVTVVRTGTPAYEALVASGSAEPPPERERASDVALQLYTSGTTGRPKGALLSHHALIQNGLTILLSQRVGHGDVFLTATPLTHAAAATRIFSLAVDGLTHVILRRFRPTEFLAAVAKHGVTTTILVPTMLADLLDEPGLGAADLSTLRTIVYGAAPCPEPLALRAVAGLPCGLLHGYGLTEGCPALTMLTPEEHVRFAADEAQRSRITSIGRPVPGVRTKIVADGVEVGPGVPGELYVRSTKAMLGYWHRDDASDVFEDGWLRTGDVTVADADGYLFLVDRVKDMLISGGLNVYPSEIERVLHAQPRVREAAVVGVADERWGEVPVAFVVGRGSALTSEELDAVAKACTAELAAYKRPRHIVQLDELPKNATGKVLKGQLRELAGSEPR